jgi:hypothetical protein
MMEQDYVAPEHGKDGFNCPHCNAFAHQEWRHYVNATEERMGGLTNYLSNLSISICARCNEHAIWVHDQLVFPNQSIAPRASSDMPEKVKEDYEEARSIFNQSPRGAAALLRLSIQELVKVLGEKGKDLNSDIGNLVKKGLPERIKQALDIVRVVGNNAVHPGEININDNPDVALKLFKLVNLIIEYMITQPKEVSGLFEVLPPGAKEAIDKRDQK